jgi:hypothetical protein
VILAALQAASFQQPLSCRAKIQDGASPAGWVYEEAALLAMQRFAAMKSANQRDSSGLEETMSRGGPIE